MKYSIIVPIYNVEAYLNTCIDSVLRQQYINWELILVDDGSPDNCPSICDEYARIDKRIKVVHKPNGGLVSARKAGLEIANGDYIICLDGDDFLHENCLLKIEEQVKNYNPDVLCYGKYNYSANSCIEVPLRGFSYGFYDRNRIEQEFLPRFISTKAGKSFSPNIWSKAYRRDVYIKYQNLVPTEVSMGEDGACTRPLLANANTMVLMPECLYYYRQIPTSMTKTKKTLSWKNFDLIYDIYRNNIDFERYNFKEQFNRLRTHNLFNICISQFYNTEYSTAVKQIQEQFKSHPEYDEAICNCTFSSTSMRFAQFTLRHRLFYLLKLYAQFRDIIKKA